MINAETNFREQYQYVNGETLEAVAKVNPYIVESVLDDNSVCPLVRSLALLALSQTESDKYLRTLKEYTQHDSALMRESAFVGLFQYFDKHSQKNLDLLGYFENALIHQTSPGVKARINSLITQMK